MGRSQIVLNAPIKTIGQYKVPLTLHSEVEISITVTVARSEDEAARIARGEDVTVRRTVTVGDAVVHQDTFFSRYKPWRATYLVGTGGG